MQKTERVKLVVILACFIICFTAPAFSKDVSDFTKKITAELEAINPEAAGLFTEANEARDNGDFEAAEKLYAEVRIMAPDFYHATRRQCTVVLELGRRDEAKELCRNALQYKETPENLLSMGLVLVSGADETAPTAKEISDGLGLARKGIKEAMDDSASLLVACQIAVQGNDLGLLRTCVRRLAQLPTEGPWPDYFAWVLAMSENRIGDAATALDKAKAAGLPIELYESMSESTEQARPFMSRYGPAAGWTIAVWAAGLALLIVFGQLLSGMALKASRQKPTNKSGEAVGLAAALRKIYKLVLWLSCAYYYISIPLVLAAVLALGGGAIYGFLVVGRIPVKLAIIIICAVCVTFWAALKSLFIRAKDEDPGDEVNLSSNPVLAATLKTVAGKIETAPVDKVFITPGTDVAVYERGGVLTKLRGASQRCLILGVGVLDGMSLKQFKAVLAHEYGHFSNKDTAGGGFALSVRRSLFTMAYALASGGAAAWYNPAWWFVNGFYKVFLRISHGASRLQEALADRWAAFAYGAQAFEEGLKHVIERSIYFNDHASRTLKEVVNAKLPLANLYSYNPKEPAELENSKRSLEKELNRPPSPYDSHPSPAERIKMVKALGVAEKNDSEDTRDAWDLFSSREKIEKLMTRRVRENLKQNHGVVIPS